MGETRGYLSIVDRTDGFGPGVVAEDQPSADATPEAFGDRGDRTLVRRTAQQADNQPDNADRSKGRGGSFDVTAGADEGYRTDGPDAVWAAENETIGTDDELEAETGYTVVLNSNHVDADVTVRPTKPLPTWNADGSVTPNASYTADWDANAD